MPHRSSTSHLLLGMVALGARTGYDIKGLVDKSTRFFWAASYGQIYPELRRLQREGLLEASEDPTGGRRRTVYALTPAGHAVLRDWLRAPGDPMLEMRNEALLKLFFADALPRDEAIEVVRRMRRKHEEVLEQLNQVRAERASGEQFPFLALQFGRGLHGWIVDWCAQLEAELEDPQTTPARTGRR